MELYTQEQVAAMWNVTPRTIQEERLKGRLRYRKVGRHVRISDADINRYLNDRIQCQEPDKTPDTSSTESMADSSSSGSSKAAANPSAQTSTSSGQKVVDLDDYQRGRQAALRLKSSH